MDNQTLFLIILLIVLIFAISNITIPNQLQQNNIIAIELNQQSQQNNNYITNQQSEQNNKIAIELINHQSQQNNNYITNQQSEQNNSDDINQYLSETGCDEKFDMINTYSSPQTNTLVPDFQPNSFNITNKINNYGYDTSDPWDNNFYKARGYMNPLDANNYANNVSSGLQNFQNPINSCTNN